MKYQRFSLFTSKLLLSFFLIFQCSKIEPMELVLTTTAAPMVTPFIIPALGLVILYKLAQDKGTPIREMLLNFNKDLLIQNDAKNDKSMHLTYARLLNIPDSIIEKKVKKFIDEFLQKQQEIAAVTYNPQSNCIHINDLKISDYTPITRITLDVHLDSENRLTHEDTKDEEPEKEKEKETEKSSSSTEFLPTVQTNLITQLNNGDLVVAIPGNNILTDTIHKWESARKHTQGMMTKGINTGILVLQLSFLLKEFNKSIKKEDLKEQDFDNDLLRNPLVQTSYKNALSQAWLLFLRATCPSNFTTNGPASLIIPDYERCQALISLNKINLPGLKGRLLREAVSRLNSLYCSRNGRIEPIDLIFKKDDLEKVALLFAQAIASNSSELDYFIQLGSYHNLATYEPYILQGFLLQDQTLAVPLVDFLVLLCQRHYQEPYRLK